VAKTTSSLPEKICHNVLMRLAGVARKIGMALHIDPPAGHPTGWRCRPIAIANPTIAKYRMV
jgi:hypothetical protein